MAWIKNKHHASYVRNSRENGRSVCRFIGGGAVGRLAAELDEAERRRRTVAKTLVEEIEQYLATLSNEADTLDDRIDGFARLTLLAEGFYLRNRHAWRKRGIMTADRTKTPKNELATLSLQEQIRRANDGDPAALAAVRTHLDENPELWRAIGDLTGHHKQKLLGQIAGSGEHAALIVESVSRTLDELRQSVLPPNPLPVHELAADRVVLAQLELHLLDSQQPRLKEDSVRLALAYQKARDSAHRRYAAALKMLATVIKLLPPRRGSLRNLKVVTD